MQNSIAFYFFYYIFISFTQFNEMKSNLRITLNSEINEVPTELTI